MILTDKDVFDVYINIHLKFPQTTTADIRIIANLTHKTRVASSYDANNTKP